MKNKILLLVIIIFFSACEANRTKKESSRNLSESVDVRYPYKIDLTKKYTERRLCLNEIANIEYIALETKDDVLVDGVFGMAVFDSCIVVCNFTKGDFLFFDRKGKFRNGFNRKGGSGEEYKRVYKWVFDNKNQEIFVYDNAMFKILVYYQTGQFKREIRFPRNRWFEQLYNYDDNLLLALIKDVSNYNLDIDPNNYVLISKKNGETISPVKSVKKTVPTSFIWRSNGEDIYIKTPMGSIINEGEDFLLSDVSSDTIYLLKKNKQLTPFLVREPSVSGTNLPILLQVSLKTDKYVFMDQTVYNIESKDMNDFFKGSKTIGIDIIKNEIFEPYFYNKDFPYYKSFNKITSFSPEYIGKNMGAKPIYAYILIEALKNGELSGQLKQIASTLHEDDNPVLMVLKFK